MHNELRELLARRVQTGDRQVLRTVREWSTTAGQFRAFYFRAEVCNGEEVPVYAVLGIPSGPGPFPGVLHYHGGGQTANPELVEMMMQRGYAALSFDWTGPSGQREHFTHWNGAEAVRYGAVNPDESILIRSLTAALQGLSILAEHPQVDPQRLGEFGISWGGFKTWLLNGVDERLKAAIAIYGCGLERDEFRRDFAAELKQFGIRDERWFELFDPTRYASRQHAPVLFANGTNDGFGWMNTYRLLARGLDSRHRCAFALHHNHAVGALNSTLLAWLDAHLHNQVFPEAPRVVLEEQPDALVARSPRLLGAESATFCLAGETGTGPDHFWHPYPAERHGEEFRVRIPVADLPVRHALIYVQQRWADALEVASVPARTEGQPAAVYAATPAGEPRAFPLGPEFWYVQTPPDPFYTYASLGGSSAPAALVFEVASGSDLTYHFNTRLVAEARWQPTPPQRFYCRLEGPVGDSVTVAFTRYVSTPREQGFWGSFSPAGLAAGISLDSLQDSAGEALRDTAGLSLLHIGGKAAGPGAVRLVGAGWRP